MTSQIYFSKLYDGYRSVPNVINSLDKFIIQEIIKNCKEDDLFVYTTWCEVDSKIEKLVSNNPSRAIIYTGMDWHDNKGRQPFHDYLKSNIKELIYIGNNDGPGYFSFWLFFIEKYFKEYTPEETTPKNLKYLFMSLNRKRYTHRKQFVQELQNNNLLERGLVSLGGDKNLGIPPLLLKNDISDKNGDQAISNSIEGISNDITSIGNLDNWNETFINVVTETTHFSSTFISEKTWKPIIGMRPFIIIGDHKIYRYLKEYGIDTFDDIFGTGYTSVDYYDRIQWAVNTLKKYQDFDYQKLYNELYSRLLHNKNQMKNIFRENKNRYNKVLSLINS